jgi:hypothetical protein
MKRTLLLCTLLLALAPPRARAQSGDSKPGAAKPSPTSDPAAPQPPASSADAAASPSPSISNVTESAVPATAATKAASAPGRAALVPAEKAQPVRIPRFDKPPVIDGRLDEDVWKRAAVLRDFYQTSPGDNIAPSKPTETLVGYDSRFLYFAFHCFDDPDKVRATVAKRDDVLGSEDSIRVLLDTFNDQRKAYVLAFNPFGVQQDGVRTEGAGVDFSVDIVMQSKGAITQDGYVVEVAIPFKSLRYEAGKGRLWGLQVFRIIQRFNGEQDSWMPLSRDISGLLSQAGHITGLEGVSTERTLELIPSVTVSETGRRVRRFSRAQDSAAGFVDPGRFTNEPVKLDPGLTAKWGITPTVTLDLAVNPDFAQVEADATVNTANQRFPIFFEEKRPFFLEGKDIFNTVIAAVHTRTIVDPDIAAKLTGKLGRNTFGLLVASDSAPGNFRDEHRFDPENLPAAISRLDGRNATVGVLRLKRDVGRENAVGLLATSYNFLGESNYVGGFDGRVRFNKITTADFQVLGTTTRRCALAARDSDDSCRTLDGFAYAYDFDQNRRHLDIHFDGVGRTRGYVADVGFTRRVNTNNHSTFVGYHSEPKPKASVVSWNVNSYFGGNFDWQGRLQDWTYEGQAGPNLQRQTFIRAGYNTGYERVFAYEFGLDAFARGRGEDSVRSKNVFAYAGSSPSKKYSFFYFFGYRWGEHDFDFGAGPRFPRVSPAALLDQDAPLDPGAGNLLYTNGNVTYKPTNALNMTLNFSKNRLVRQDTGRVAFDSNIVSLRTTYQFTRFTFARARIDYSSISSNVRGQFLLGWTPNPGTAFYAGYNDDMNRGFFNPFTGQLEPGFRRNGRTFFVKMSYLFRRSFGG